jgi:hypothetical protein
MNQLPTTHPAEVLVLSPESLEVANTYLITGSVEACSQELGVATTTVLHELEKPETKRYIDQVFLDLGFNNRFKMRKAMDAVISKKFEELDEAGVGSSKDIADLLALSHKMTMEELSRQIELEKLKTKNTSIKSQVNVQINEGVDKGSNYGNLLERLMKG